MNLSSFAHEWIKHVKARDIQGLLKLLDKDFYLNSPVSTLPIKDIDTVAKIFETVLMVIPDINYTSHLAGDDQVCLIFSGHIGETYIQGIDIFALNEQGKCKYLTVMMRPLESLTVFADNMKRGIRRPG